MNRSSHFILSTAALAGLGLCTAGLAAEPSYDELLRKVDQLQARLDQVENKQQSLSGEQVNATVERVLRDADRRSQIFAADGGFTAGYDKGFFLKSEDGNFTLRPGILFQFRNITNYRGGDTDDLQNGFEFRRVRPRLDGNAFSPDFTYSLVLDVNRSGGNVALLDAWAQYRVAPQWAVKFGQFRESWNHEGDVSDSAQLTVERSLVDSLLGGSQVDRIQGVSLIYGGTAKDAFRAEATYHDGANSKNTDFRDVTPGATAGDPPIYSANLGAGARIEYKFSGNWADYKDFTAKNNKDTLLVVGGGFDWTQNGDTDIYRTTADVQWEGTNGLNAYAAVNGNFTELGTVAAGAEDSRFDWGALAQVGYLLNPSWEVFGRYDVVALDSDFITTGEDTFNEFTVGVNYFLGANGSYLHKAKLTFDLIYLPEGAPSNQTGVGVLANNGDEEVVFRGQFQLLL